MDKISTVFLRILATFIFVCTLFPCLVYSQQNTNIVISGQTLDENNQPLAGVNVQIKNSPEVGSATTAEGFFTIKTSIGGTLVFSLIGFEKFEYLALKSVDTLKVILRPGENILEETVVVGLGTQRKISMVGAVTTVDPKDLQRPATTLNNLIGGRVPGIISMQSSGEPGKNISEFWVRGIGTFGANSGALVLIDGLEGTLSQVDPADVESFSVLKDASATAVYGVRGANGVVLITTKRGQVEKLSITARVSSTISSLKKLPDFLDAYDYATLANEALVVSGKQPLYNDVQMEIIKNNLDPDLYPNVDWQKEILRKTSFQNTYYASARGGGAIARYFMSLGMSNESAAYKQEEISKYKRRVGYNTYNYRLNLDVNITPVTSVYLGIDGHNATNYLPGMANTDWLWSAQSKLAPLTVPKQFSNGASPAYGTNDEISPYVLLNNTGMAKDQSYRNMATISLKHDFKSLVSGLTGKIQGAFDNRAYFLERRDKRPDLFNSAGRTPDGELIMIKKVNGYDATYSKTQSQWRKFHLEGNLNYEKLFAENHRTTVLLYYYMSNEESTEFNSSLSAIPKRYQGISSRVTYGYKDTYLVDLNFGYTGSENFKRGEQFGFFPSIAVGWVPSQYGSFKERIKSIDYLKIRGSYGTVGNDRISNDRFPYLTIINSNAPGGWGGQGLIETVVGADNLRWEVAKKANLGVELKMFNNDLDFVVDVFHDTRDGIFQRRTQLPTWVGSMTMPYGNVGSMVSYGADGNLGYTFRYNDHNSITVRGNFTYALNEVKNWEQPYQEYEYLSHTGKPYNVLRGFKAIGLFKDENEIQVSPEQFGKLYPGDIKYKDVTGDGKIDDDDRIPLSYSPIPRLMYGIAIEKRFKDLTFSVLFKGTGNTSFFMNANGFGYLPFYGGEIGNVLSIVKDQKNRWTPAWYSGDKSTENPDAMFPRLTYGRNENNEKLSSFWLANSKYLRLQEATVNYQLHNDWLTKIGGIRSVDLQLVGYNLAVWDKVKIWDPELANSNGNAYPIPVRVAFQLYINF